jgi:hypothetical protein
MVFSELTGAEITGIPPQLLLPGHNTAALTRARLELAGDENPLKSGPKPAFFPADRQKS